MWKSNGFPTKSGFSLFCRIFQTHLHTRYGESPHPSIQFQSGSCWFISSFFWIPMCCWSPTLNNTFGCSCSVSGDIKIAFHHFEGWHRYIFVKNCSFLPVISHIYIYTYLIIYIYYYTFFTTKLSINVIPLPMFHSFSIASSQLSLNFAARLRAAGPPRCSPPSSPWAVPSRASWSCPLSWRMENSALGSWQDISDQSWLIIGINGMFLWDINGILILWDINGMLMRC
jgi:hypothetical protein